MLVHLDPRTNGLLCVNHAIFVCQQAADAAVGSLRLTGHAEVPEPKRWRNTSTPYNGNCICYVVSDRYAAAQYANKVKVEQKVNSSYSTQLKSACINKIFWYTISGFRQYFREGNSQVKYPKF